MSENKTPSAEPAVVDLEELSKRKLLEAEVICHN